MGKTRPGGRRNQLRKIIAELCGNSLEEQRPDNTRRNFQNHPYRITKSSARKEKILDEKFEELLREGLIDGIDRTQTDIERPVQSAEVTTCGSDYINDKCPIHGSQTEIKNPYSFEEFDGNHSRTIVQTAEASTSSSNFIDGERSTQFKLPDSPSKEDLETLEEFHRHINYFD